MIGHQERSIISLDYFRKKTVALAIMLLLLTAALFAACDTGTQPTATPVGPSGATAPTPVATTQGGSSASGTAVPSAQATIEPTLATTGTVVVTGTVTVAPNQ